MVCLRNISVYTLHKGDTEDDDDDDDDNSNNNNNNIRKTLKLCGRSCKFIPQISVYNDVPSNKIFGMESGRAASIACSAHIVVNVSGHQ
jgi:hypothetical protein